MRAGDRLAPGDPRRHTVVRCLGCGLAYLRPRPTREATGRCYPESYSGSGRGGLVEALEAAYRRRQHGEVARWLAGRRPLRGRLLDVGCGAGELLATLRADGWSVQGVEPQALGAAEARDRHGLNVLSGRFEEVALPEGSYEVIVFSGVCEHLHDPVAELRRARALLAPGGLVAVLFLPMLDSPEARLLGPRWMALDLPRHLTHFEEATFAEMATKAGFGVAGRETYSRRHNPAQLVGSLAPLLQKHRFYAAENGPRASAAPRLAAVAQRVAFLAAVTAARLPTRLAAVAGAPSMCSYFLEPAGGASARD
ncbi:MAG: class I SAM-dependent methyltransferase [Actinobacteria bacterium]|nr:class I SAM-dependent methyltransferase [Actinomycetota bacterium]